MDDTNGLSYLPNIVIKNALDEVIKKEIKSDEFSMKIESGSSKGDNYIGVVYRVKVTTNCKLENNNSINNKDNNNKKELSIIIKLPPQNEIRRKQFFARPAFVREALMYDEVLPMLMDFQRSKGINPLNAGFHEVPKCLKTITDDGYEAIFLEDLGQLGFQMYNRLKPITYEHVELIMRALAKMHAVGFAIKDQNPDKLAKYMDLTDIFSEREEDEHMQKYVDSLRQRAVDSLDPEEDQKLIEKINKFFATRNFISIMLDLVNGKAAEPYSILCHGDCWNNNMLFRYENDRPVEVKLIDFQISRYASPVTDLMYYLFTCTTKEFRDQYYDSLLNLYHNQLCTVLKSLGSNPEKVFPRKALNDQLQKFGKFGLLMSMMLLPIITSYAEDIPDLDELSEQFDSGNLDVINTFNPKQTLNVYQSRIRGTIFDMVRLGYF